MILAPILSKRGKIKQENRVTEAAMLIKKPSDIPYSEVTPKSVYMNRRNFLAGVAAASGARSVSDWLEPARVFADETKLGPLVKSPFSTSEMPTSYKDVTHYNNYYEFGTDK